MEKQQSLVKAYVSPEGMGGKQVGQSLGISVLSIGGVTEYYIPLVYAPTSKTKVN